MLPPHLRKFTELYESYGLGAVKNVWLLTCLIPLARTVNLFKMKDYVGGVLGKENTNPDSDYKRLTRWRRVFRLKNLPQLAQVFQLKPEQPPGNQN